MRQQVTFHNLRPAGLSLREAVLRGLAKPQKSIPPKFFYDARGSALFDTICEQPEYYPPTVERRILAEQAEEIASLVGPGRMVIEPGAGSAEKVQLLLDALRPTAYVPMDISCDYLRDTAECLADSYSWLPVHAVCVDFAHSLPVPETAPNADRLVFFPGSSLGNFEPHEALGFLRMCRETVGAGGMMLIGVDTKKDHAILNAAYNDAAGVTAAFNRNLLQRIRRELGSDCRLDRFDHHAFYNAAAGRVEMHLVSTCEQQLRVDGQSFRFAKGESLHTECSYKYAPDEFMVLARQAGFGCMRHWLDADRLFAVYLLATDGCR